MSQGPWGNRVLSAAYDVGVFHRVVAKPFARATLGFDVDVFYDLLRVVETMPDGAAVLDVPCGGGIALSGLRSWQRIRYVGADASPVMLDRAAARARERRLGVELVQADIAALPFADAEFDLALCLNGLHCVDDPATGVAELARCLRPGGRIVGTCVLRGQRRRTDVWIEALTASGYFGTTGYWTDVRGWLVDADLAVEDVAVHGAVAVFSATAR